MIQIKDILFLTPMMYKDLETNCDLPFGYLQNRRYKEFRSLRVDIALKLAKLIRIDIDILVKLTKDDIERFKQAKFDMSVLTNQD